MVTSNTLTEDELVKLDFFEKQVTLFGILYRDVKFIVDQ